MGLTRPKLYQFDTSVNNITDPITVLHAGATMANVDVGFLVNRANGLLSNVAIYWSETSGSFVTAYTTSSGGVDSNIAVTSYAPITVGNLITTNGVYWANGSPYSSGSGGGSYGNTQVAQYLPTYTGNVNAANVVVTSGVYSPAYFYANGTPFASSGSSGAKITTSSTAPVSPNTGDFWYDTATDIKSQYVNDGVASYWVDETGPTISNTAPLTTVGNIVGTTSGNAYITGSLIPTSNIAYDLGTTTQRFRSLYLSGNTIDLGGASIKTDATTGAIAFVPQPTAANPNPTGIVVSPTGTISTVSTTGGVLASNAISTSSNASTTSGSTFSNANVTATLTAGNITTASGLFWANGTSALTSSYGNTQVAGYLPTYSGNVNAANVVTTSGVYSPAYFYANGVAFTSSSYGNTQVSAYLPTYAGNITAGNITISGTVSTSSLTETSSLLLKENIRSIDDPFEILLQLIGVVYDRKDGSSFNEPGLIAEAVALISPALVSKNADGAVEGVKYTRIIAYLIEAIKQLKQCETQNNKIISDLIQSVEELKTEIDLLRGSSNGNT